MNVKTLTAVIAASLVSSALAATVAGVEVPAPYAPCPVTDTYWNVKVEDPYRCLETTTDEKVQQYMKAQAAATEAVLARIPSREKLLKRIQEIDSEIPANVTDVNRAQDGRLFYEKRLATDNQYKLYVRQGFDGPEKVLVDPDAIARAAGGKPHAIGDYANSRDGKRVAYSISAGGAEIGTLHAIDVDTGKEVMPAIDRIRGGGASWLEDGSGFFYSRLAEGWEKRPRAERFMDNVVYLRRLDDPANDVAVFGPTVHPELKLDRSDGAAVFEMAGQPLAFAFVYHGVDRYRSLYVTDKPALLAGKPKWRKVFDRSDQVGSIAAHGEWLYLRSAKDAPRYKVLRVRLPEADLSKAEVLIPAGNEVITAIAGAPEGLYYTRREGAAKKLFRVAHGEPAGKAEAITLPFEGNVAISDVDARIPGAILTLSGWTRSPRHYFIGPKDTAPKPLALAPAGKYDTLSGVTAREVKVRSHDGVEVPMSIISRTDIKLDGGNPAQVYGYAAYGIVEEPALNARYLAWLDHGGVFAICHARGGGINGDEWHKAGHKQTKFNTWKDGIACAEWLVANGYTSKQKLSIYGGSAGGIFVGRAITERPDLFGAASIGVGNLDQVRSETRANGAGNIPEYGTVKVESEFHALRNNSTYENIKPGVTYPATMFEHGVNDTRVDVWMTTKAATRFAAANPSGRPMLMRLEYDAGHGVGSTRIQSQQRTADRWAFFLWQAGLPEFQPK